MNFYPTFYFRPLARPLILSKEFGISLRPPSEEELPLWRRNVRNIFGGLSDKEKRRILYTLHPLGLPKASGSLDEIFTDVLAPLWLGLEFPDPFFLKPEEYGALCGMASAGGYLRSPHGFAASLDEDRRLFLRALKLGLGPISSLDSTPELCQLQSFAAGLDGILSQEGLRSFLRGLGRALGPSPKGQEARFLQQALGAEILTVSEGGSRSRQFAQKLTLIRHVMLRKKGEGELAPPEKTEDLFTRCYQMRSDLVHGRTGGSAALTEKSQMLFTTVRLALQMMVQDPLLFFYIKNL